MWLQRLVDSQVPGWARLDSPMLRYVLLREGRRQGRGWRWLVRGGLVLVVIALVGGYAWVYDDAGTPGDGASTLFSLLYVPLLMLQIVTLTAPLILTSNMIAAEQQRGTWEALKITSHGAEMAIRSRWAAVFYQLRWLLAALLLARLLFTGQMLRDLTLYQGYHLDLYIIGITPEVPLEVAIVLLAALMTALLLLPLVIVGLNAAFGLLFASMFDNPRLTVFLRGLLLALELGIFLAALVAGLDVIDADPGSRALAAMSPGERWARLAFMGSFGDQGLRLMDLETTFQTWTDVEYGILLGAGLLGAVAIIVLATNGMLWWAARRAAHPAQE